jgi:hypothetical protein
MWNWSAHRVSARGTKISDLLFVGTGRDQIDRAAGAFSLLIVGSHHAEHIYHGWVLAPALLSDARSYFSSVTSRCCALMYSSHSSLLRTNIYMDSMRFPCSSPTLTTKGLLPRPNGVKSRLGTG